VIIAETVPYVGRRKFKKISKIWGGGTGEKKGLWKGRRTAGQGQERNKKRESSSGKKIFSVADWLGKYENRQSRIQGRRGIKGKETSRRGGADNGVRTEGMPSHQLLGGERKRWVVASHRRSKKRPAGSLYMEEEERR